MVIVTMVVGCYFIPNALLSSMIHLLCYVKDMIVSYISMSGLVFISHLTIPMQKRKDDATAALDSLYNEIRPAIEEHERDNQDSVSTTVAEKWIQACCLKLKEEFDLYSSIVKNVACTAQRAPGQPKPTEDYNDNEVKLLTN